MLLSGLADRRLRCQSHIITPPRSVMRSVLMSYVLPIGLVNPNCVGLIGNGVVVHLPSFFEELDALESEGLDCANRLFISDRAQLVFDFHQIVDGLKEVELGGSRYESESFSIVLGYLCEGLMWGCSIGTTKKGIGPAYSGKASRSGLRVHHLFDNGTFAAKFRKLVEGRYKRYGHFEYDTEREILRYQVGSACSVLSSQTHELLCLSRNWLRD